MDNLVDYMYLFDRLIKNNYPYIINMNSKMTSGDRDIYLHAKIRFLVIYIARSFSNGQSPKHD